MNYIKKVFDLIRICKLNIFLLIICFLTSSALTTLSLSMFTLYANNSENFFLIKYFNLNFSDESYVIFFLICFFFIIKNITLIMNNYVINYQVTHSMHNLRSAIYDSVLKSFYRFQVYSKISTIINNLSIRTNEFVIKVIRKGLELISEFVIFLSIFSYLLYSNFFITSFIIIILSIFVLLFDQVSKWRVEKYGYEFRRTLDKISSLATVLSGSIKEIFTSNSISFFRIFFRKASLLNSRAAFKNYFLSSSIRPLFELFLILIIFIIFFHFSVKNKNNFLNFSDILVYLLAIYRARPFAENIAIFLNSLRFIQSTTNVLHRDIYSEVKFQKQIVGKFESLHIKNLNFSYSGSNKTIFQNIGKGTIFNDLNINLNKGEMICIRGKTGSGKTTFLDIVAGIYGQNDSVKFQLSGHKNMVHGPIRDLMYMYNSEFIFDNSIMQNITLEAEINNVNFTKLNSILRVCQLDNLINSYDEKLQKLINLSKLNLSSGQLQRICLARLLYFDKNLLIMDEPTSKLDYDTERKLVSELKKYCSKKCLIISSHSNIVQDIADRVYEIKNFKLISVK